MFFTARGKALLNPETILKRLKVKKGAVLADLGCGGGGHFTGPAAKQVGKDSKVYAVDILKPVLQAVTSKARLEGINNIKSIWSNLELVGATKIPENSLDFALIINIIHSINPPENILKEAIRLIKSGGKILIIDWDQNKSPFGPDLQSRIQPDKVKQLTQSLNLKLIDEFQAGPYHFGLIFKK